MGTCGCEQCLEADGSGCDEPAVEDLDVCQPCLNGDHI